MASGAEQRDRLRELAVDAGRRLDAAPAEDVLGWAIDTFGGGLCIAASMADAVLVAMADRLSAERGGSGVDVLFLDTGYHFAETLQTRDLVAARYRSRVLTVLPRQSVAEQDEVFGPALHDRDPDACCTLRKVEPLRRGLDPYTAWASGIRRDETDSRREIGTVEWDANRELVKVNPLATWTQADVDAYILEHDVVVNPLLFAGYPSIGCAPCTRQVGDGADPRSGRWAGSGKTECGLHLDSDGTPVRPARS